ncbi:cytochrome P450 [Bombardia bombarda]|uniref:Cytochrome P450 n=1 Tax=Bombardia bombarda TaxID=252184 RepID=A0AA39U368_9PEZI|nr:cytochrome P450 [Bombardia bombarda]
MRYVLAIVFIATLMAILLDIQTSWVAPLAALGLLAAVYKLIIYPSLLSPLAKIPAARWHARFSPLYSYYIKWANIENRTVDKLHKKYGPVIRLGPNELSVNCYEGGIKTIYMGNFPKTDWFYNRFGNYGTQNLFTIIDSKEHGQFKRILNPVFSKSAILTSSALHTTSSAIILDRLIPILRRSSISSAPINIHLVNFAYAIDSYTAFQLGATLGTNFTDNPTLRDDILHHFFGGRPYMFWDTELPKLTSFLGRLGCSPVPKWCTTSRLVIESFFMQQFDAAAKVVDSSQNEATKQPTDPDWPTVFATARQGFDQQQPKRNPTGGDAIQVTVPWYNTLCAEGPPHPHRLVIASNMLDQIVAAIETIGTALTYVHYELSKRPDLQAALREELLAASSMTDLLSADTNTKTGDTNLPTLKTLSPLPFLDAILRETLRRYPPNGGMQARATPDICTIAGYANIPPGVRVQGSAWCLHRNPEVFPDPEEWRPRRWLDASPQELVEMRKWFWAFGGGARICLGRDFSMASMKLVVAAIYTRFTTELVDADGIEQDDGFSGGPVGNKLWLQFREIQDAVQV